MGPYLTQGEVLNSPLLKFIVGAANVRVLAQDSLNFMFDLGEQVNKFHIGCQKETTRWQRAQMVFGVQQAELHLEESGKHEISSSNMND